MQVVQLALLSAAFWIALWGARRRRHVSRESSDRLLMGLVLSGGLAHLGWLALHPAALRGAGLPAVAYPLRGFSLLFVPAGPLLVASWRRGVSSALRELAPICRVLPLALALARSGCLVAGCCAGIPVVGGDGLHPVREYEIGGWLVLTGALVALASERVAPVFLIGFGALRLLLEPLRAPGSFTPALSPAWLAGAWLGLGLSLLAGARRGSAAVNPRDDDDGAAVDRR